MSSTFSEFKDKFYRRVKDLSVFDCEEFNTLKVVLDGLKVDYVSKNMHNEFIFKSNSEIWLWLFLRRVKYAKHVSAAQAAVRKMPADKEILLLDSGRMIQNVQGHELSYYFENVKDVIGREKLYVISHDRTGFKIDDEQHNIEYATLFEPLSYIDALFIKSLHQTYHKIASAIEFSETELRNIRIAFTKFFIEYRFWRRLLKHKKFRYCIFNQHYHREGMILAMRRAGVKMIELQHGLIAREDIFYVFPPAVRPMAYKALFPDKMLTYGEYWSEVLSKGSEFTKEQVEVIGSYQVVNTQVKPEQEQELNVFTGEKPFILITTQTFLHSYFIDYATWLSAWLLNKNDATKIVLKLHPSEDKALYKSLEGITNISIMNFNTEFLLSRCKYHISIYSTTLYDALKYNCQNFSLDIDVSRDYVRALVEKGVSYLLKPSEAPTDMVVVAKPRPDTRLFYDSFQQHKHKLLHLPALFMNNSVKTCSRCILSVEDTDQIFFDAEGVCNYCRYYDQVTQKIGDKSKSHSFIQAKVEEVKRNGQGHAYDCILGVSGGTDSSYLAYWAHQNGLRPLVVHFDNGWNSELAVENIQQICDKLGFSLQTYVVNWEEFRNLQLAYLRAGVVDIEVLTDHAIYATIYKIAAQYKIRYTLNGFNYATEAIMPKGWVFDKTDFTNINDINRKFGARKIKTFPHVTFLKKFWYLLFLKIESIQVLNYIDYHKDEAKELLKRELGWRDYGGKHYESVFTKFYQAYILPTKFGIDKRKAHLATMICSGQTTRAEALEELKKPLYEARELQEEKEYVLKKLGVSEKEFDAWMAEPPRKHTDFKTQQKLWERYFKIIQLLRPWKK